MTLITIIIFAITCFVIIDKKEGRYTVEGRRKRKLEKEMQTTIKYEPKKYPKKIEESTQLTMKYWIAKKEAMDEIAEEGIQISFFSEQEQTEEMQKMIYKRMQEKHNEKMRIESEQRQRKLAIRKLERMLK